MLFVSEQKQIALIADEKTPTRISHRSFATSCSEMRNFMANMSALYIGLSGLTNSSNALNTTANNMANVNTKGYVRQQVVFGDTQYNVLNRFATATLQRGNGVTIQQVAHVRDILLDEAYRKENGRYGFYDKLTKATDEIQTQLGELNGISYQNSISDLLSAINEVAKTPDDNTARAALVQSAVSFFDRSQSVYKGLVSYQDSLNTEIANITNRINEIGEQIKYLNGQISTIECGVETAMTMRDERDLLLDELSGYVKIDYSEDANHVVTVMMEGQFFCDGLSVSHLGLSTVEGTSFYIPIWSEMQDHPLYDMELTMSTAKNTDIGSLKGLLAARGTISPTYANMTEPAQVVTEKPDRADYESDEDYNAAIAAYTAYRDYQSFISCKDYSVMARSIANFDKMVNNIVEQINNVLSPMKDATFTYIDDNGNTVNYTGKIFDMDKTDYGKDAAKTPGTELFSRKYTDRYKQVTGTDGQTYYIYNTTNELGLDSIYSIANLEVNPDVLYDFSVIPLSQQDGKVDYDRAKEITALFSQKSMFYREGSESLTFEQFYEALVDDVGSEGKIYESMTQNQDNLSAGLDNGRQEVMGVSSDEELTNMIRYQQAYNAASRYINVITTMMDTVIQMI